jgi:polar amino acid transport system substrate-binding protein
VLAPTGTLRAVFLGGNPVQGRVDPVSGATSGPVPDLVREFARRLGVGAGLLSVPNAAAVTQALRAGTADIGFLAFDDERAKEVDFGPAYVVMLNSFLVKADSPIRTSADVDQPGVVVALVRGTSQQLFLSRTLTRVRFRMFETMPAQAEVEKLLESGEVSAFGINRQRSLEAQAAAGSRLRVLPESFMRVDQSVVVLKGAGAKLDLLVPMMNDLLRSGFVKESVDRAKISGAEVATPR